MQLSNHFFVASGQKRSPHRKTFFARALENFAAGSLAISQSNPISGPHTGMRHAESKVDMSEHRKLSSVSIH
jgi:hypothetical protein